MSMFNLFGQHDDDDKYYDKRTLDWEKRSDKKKIDERHRRLFRIKSGRPIFIPQEDNESNE